MFDAQTASLLRSAPSFPGMDSTDIPQILTRHYAELVSERLRGNQEDLLEVPLGAWSLDRIADTYEIVTSLEPNPELRRAAAFVAGTAQQIISRRQVPSADDPVSPLLSRNSLDATVAAALLFLAAEQYADAREAGSSISANRGSYEVQILGEHIKDLVSGRLESIVQRASRWRREDQPLRGSVQNQALRALADALSEGLELLAVDMMSAPLPSAMPRRFQGAQAAFKRVLALSVNHEDQWSELLGGELLTTYTGPAHLASLLLAVSDSIEQAALTKLPPPEGADSGFWQKWLAFRALEMPFVWPNHREAIRRDLYQSGVSSVLVLPTGAGKTTVSALKIAATLAKGKKVIFLAPTHALVEQLSVDLQEIFPGEEFGLKVSSDFDSLLVDETQLQDIEVMTPERCLAMLSFTPGSFAGVGLLVFDECHLLSPQSGKIGRSLDGMLCLLAFHASCPQADMLFLSAMLRNAAEFAEWIAHLTKRRCEAIELFWKPSRQARGVVVYDQRELQSIIKQATQTQQVLDQKAKKRARSLRSAAKRELLAVPYVVWGLQHNWISAKASYTYTLISANTLQLSAGYDGSRVWITPNANSVAARIASSAAAANLKTIVFVNTKADAIGTAERIADDLGEVVPLTDAEEPLWKALQLELGDVRHSVFRDAKFGAVPHNASMLRLERALSERLFRRPNGAKVIVATPTLAQGLNLPAHLAVLAGDKRAGSAKGTREELEAHELLNAAARAGRAGHLANGIVVLIPEPTVNFVPGTPLNHSVKQKLLSIMPEDDRCVTISDPLEVVLDRLMQGKNEDRDVRYTLNRLVALVSDQQTIQQDNLMSRSFGTFCSQRKNLQEEYTIKIQNLFQKVSEVISGSPETIVILIASQSGLPLEILERLRQRLLASVGMLPMSVSDWVSWTIEWLKDDSNACNHLFMEVQSSMLTAIGQRSGAAIDSSALSAILPGVSSWLEGKPINAIELALGGDPEGLSDSAKMCMRARELVSTFIPRGLAFVIGVVARMAEELNLPALQAGVETKLIQSLSAAVRKGFDSVDKLEFANSHREILGRVAAHLSFAEERERLFAQIAEMLAGLDDDEVD